MRKRLAKWFLLVAKRLDPSTHIEDAQYVEGYDARKLGLSYLITKKDIKNYRFKDGARMSLREGRRRIINDARKSIRAHIIEGISAYRLIDYSIKEDEDGILVSGELRVYVPKEEGDEEDKEQPTQDEQSES